MQGVLLPPPAEFFLPVGDLDLLVPDMVPFLLGSSGFVRLANEIASSAPVRKMGVAKTVVKKRNARVTVEKRIMDRRTLNVWRTSLGIL